MEAEGRHDLDGEFDAAVGAEAVAEFVEVGTDRSGCDAEFRGDLLVLTALQEQRCNLGLARRDSQSADLVVAHRASGGARAGSDRAILSFA